MLGIGIKLWIPGGAPAAAPPNTLVAGTGTFVLSGEAMAPLVDYKLPANAAAFVLTGQTSGLISVRTMAAAFGSFAFTGQDATLTKSGTFSLTATDNATDTTGTTTITFGGKNFAIGPADATRVIAIAFASRNSGGTSLASSVSINGGAISASAGPQRSGSADNAEVWYAAVPSGTTCTISITFSSANQRTGIQVYSIIGASSAAPAASGTDAQGSGSVGATLSIPSGGAAIGVAYSLGGGPGTPTGSPAGFTNIDLNSNITGTQQIWALHSNAGVLSGSQALSTTITSSATIVGAFAAWGP